MSVPDAEVCEISVIEGGDDNSRLVFAVRLGNAEQPILLRQESYSRDVGWFVQNEIAMTRQEMVNMRTALGGKMHRACERTMHRIEKENDNNLLRIYRGSATG